MEEFICNNKADATGTSLQGYLKIKPCDLINKFGPSRMSKDSKVTIEWIFTNKSAQPFTIYDYRGRPSSSKDPHLFHVGALNGSDVKDFVSWVLVELNSPPGFFITIGDYLSGITAW